MKFNDFVYLLLLMILFGSSAHAKVIHQERSLYRNILVEEQNDLRCLKFNVKSKKSNQTCMLKSDPQRLVFNYTKLVLSSLLLIEKPTNILIVGLGGGTLSNTLHELYPNSTIDNIEIDPAVIKVARKYFGFFENNNIRTYAQDGRIFVKRAMLKKKQYDLIILDAFNGDYIPEHLMTMEFFQELKSILSPQGIIAANTFSSSGLYQHESATYHAVFGDFYSVSNQINSNRIILASATEPVPINEIKLRSRKLATTLAPYDVDLIEISQSFVSTKNNKDWPEDTKLLTDQFSPANLLNQ